jgi:GLPGLI family protein
MTCKNNFFLYILSLFVFVGISGCDHFNSTFRRGISEGVINYKISFPNSGKDQMMTSLLPEKMVFTFKDNNSIAEFETIGGVFTSRTVAFQDSILVNSYLKLFKKKIVLQLDETGLETMLSEQPAMTIIDTDITDTIAGYLCRKAIAVFDDISIPEINLYYTEKIDFKDPNWCNQYRDIDGVLLSYEIVQFGIRMRFDATSVEEKEIDETVFTPIPDFKSVNFEEMKVEMEKIVSTFNM